MEASLSLRPKIVSAGPILRPCPAIRETTWRNTACPIAPNPGLSPAQKKVIERDYGMRGGTADLKVRKALAYYTKHRLGLDLDPTARRPEDQHVVLVRRQGS